MLKSFHFCLIIYLSTVLSSHATLTTTTTTTTLKDDVVVATPATIIVSHNDVDDDDCLTNSLEKSILCRGSRALRNVINNLNKSDKPIVIVRGLEIVRSKDNGETAARSMPLAAGASPDDSVLGRFSEYLRTHELSVKFSDLLADESERYLARDLERNGVRIGIGDNDDGIANVEEARKKDKGQGGLLMAMGLMFGKMMAVMGLGGVGMLAMKALGVAMAALMMAGMVGMKTLAQHGGGGGGHETTHSVQYLTADGHHHKRRRRSLRKNEIFNPMPLVYGGWRQELMKTDKK